LVVAELRQIQPLPLLLMSHDLCYRPWRPRNSLDGGRKIFRMAGRFVVAILAIAVAVVLGMVIAGICLGHPYIYDPL